MTTRQFTTVFGTAIYGVNVLWQHDPTQTDANKKMKVTVTANMYAQGKNIRFAATGGSAGTAILGDTNVTNYNVGLVWNNPITASTATAT